MFFFHKVTVRVEDNAYKVVDKEIFTLSIQQADYFQCYLESTHLSGDRRVKCASQLLKTVVS